MRYEDIRTICKEIAQLPLKMNGRYMVTGAGGFIGGYIVETLLILAEMGDNIQVTALVRDIEKAKRKFSSSPNLSFVSWDMEDSLELQESFDYIIHTASPIGKDFFQFRSYDTMRQNVMGCIHLLDLCKKIQPKRILYVGSASSYGGKIMRGMKEGISEDTVGEFMSMKCEESYSISKLTCEYLMRCAAEQMNFQVMTVRLFSVYGPDMNIQSGTVFADLFSQAMTSNKLVISGNGAPIRNFGYITDIVTGIFIVLHLGTSNEVYNIGSITENYSIYEFARKLAFHHPTVKRILTTHSGNEPLTSKSVQIPDLKKLCSLGWRSCVSLDEGIQRLFTYYDTGNQTEGCEKN